MKFIKYTAFALALGSTATVAADCERPEKPTIPNGASSSMEEMLEGQKAVKAFQADNLAYMHCLEPELAAAEAAAKEGDEAAVDQYKAIEADYNAAVSAEEEVAGQFNTEIREYKAAQAK